MKIFMVIIGILVLFVFMVGGFFVSKYNNFVSLQTLTQSSWAEVENQLKRRSDLIPNLVNTVKGYAKHEKDLFTHIADARAKLAGAKSVAESAKANRELNSSLSRLLMVVENYPQLKADKSFIRLQDELAGTENRLAVARRRYNDAVRDFNYYLKKLPDRFIAGFMGLKAKEYFKVEEAAKKVPNVKF